MSFGETNSGNEVAAKLELFQQEQSRRLIGSGVLGRMALADSRVDTALRSDGTPIVLSSEADNLRFVFLAIRSKATGGHLRSKVFQVGKQVDGQNFPNEGMGIVDEDMVLFDDLLEDAKTFKNNIAPNYSLEFGVIK